MITFEFLLDLVKLTSVFQPNNVIKVLMLHDILQVYDTFFLQFAATEWVKGKQMDDVVTIKNT